MPISDSAVINAISLFVYQAIVHIQQQQPELLDEKYRKVQWNNARNQSLFLNKLNEQLKLAQDWDACLVTVRRFLHVFFQPDSLETPVLQELFHNVQGYIQGQGEVGLNRPLNSERVEPVAPVSPGIAILLLDAENLQLNPETEKFLAGICTYPIQIKIAFANWRSMGKQDVELHGRGYELIHVPPGKDSADVKMATVGSSIFVHYPTAKEVLVCSSDGVMTHLCTTLQTHGLTVYRVRNQGDTLTVANNQTGHTQTYSLLDLPEIPSLEQFITQLKAIIRDEQIQTGNPWIRLSRISSLFKAKYKLTISQVVSIHLPGKRARDIFSNFPKDFVVHQLPEQSEIYITLFDTNSPNTTTKNNSSTSTTSKKSQTTKQSLVKIESKTDLEQALIKIVESLTANSPESYVPISNVASEFNKHYKTAITNVIKSLKLGTKVHQVLQSSSVFKLKQVGTVYHVALSQTRSQ